MPEDIQEIPLDIAEEMQDIVKDIPELLPEPPVAPAVWPPEEVKPVIKPKAKGRPKGSCNKGPSKPRAKKAQIQETPVEAPVGESYEPSTPRRNLRIPTNPSSSEVAAAMLKLLQDQSYSRQSRKQTLYSSWLQ